MNHQERIRLAKRMDAQRASALVRERAVDPAVQHPMATAAAPVPEVKPEEPVAKKGVLAAIAAGETPVMRGRGNIPGITAYDDPGFINPIDSPLEYRNSDQVTIIDHGILHPVVTEETSTGLSDGNQLVKVDISFDPGVEHKTDPWKIEEQDGPSTKEKLVALGINPALLDAPKGTATFPESYGVELADLAEQVDPEFHILITSRATLIAAVVPDVLKPITPELSTPEIDAALDSLSLLEASITTPWHDILESVDAAVVAMDDEAVLTYPLHDHRVDSNPSLYSPVYVEGVLQYYTKNVPVDESRLADQEPEVFYARSGINKEVDDEAAPDTTFSFPETQQPADKVVEEKAMNPEQVAAAMVEMQQKLDAQVKATPPVQQPAKKQQEPASTYRDSRHAKLGRNRNR